jgi:hypothetical protein
VNFAGVEELQIGTEFWPRIHTLAPIEPEQADNAVFATDAPRPRLRIGVAISQANEGENIDFKALHHLMHSGCSPLYRPAYRQTHDMPPLSLRSKPIIAKSARKLFNAGHTGEAWQAVSDRITMAEGEYCTNVYRCLR